MAGGIFVGSVYATMELQTGGFAGDIARAQTQLKSFDNAQVASSKASQGWAKSVTSSVHAIDAGLTGLATKLGIGALAGAAIGGVFVKSAADLQQTAQSMKVLTGSTKVANKLFGQLATYANSTPFEFPNIAKGAQVMLGFGVKAEDVYGHVQTLGDIAAATGADFESLALVFGQVNATGKLMGQDALQLINNKVPITTILAKKLGISVQDVRKRMEEGKISAKDFNGALTDVTKKGGFAFKGVDVLAQTFNGRMSTLKDTVLEFGRNLLGVRVDPKLGLVIQKGGLFDQFSNAIPIIIENLKKVTPAIQSGFKWIVDNGDTLVAIAAGFITALAAAKIASIGVALATFVVNFGVMAGLIKGATAAQWGFNVAMAANPIGLIIAAIVALVAGLVFLQVKFGFLTKIWDAIVVAATPFVNFLKTYIWPILVQIGNFVGGVFMDAWNQLKKAWNELMIALQPIMPQLKILGMILVGVVVGAFLAVIAPVVAVIAIFIAIVTAIAWVTARIAQFSAFMIGTWNKISGSVRATISGLVNSVIGFFASMMNRGRQTIGDGINGVISLFNRLPSNIRGALGNLGSLLVNAGADLIRGLVNGIGGNGNAVVNKIKEICSGALDAVKNFFGIKSPSKVMMKMGGYLMQGFSNGVSDQESMMMKTMYQASQSVTDAFNPNMSMSSQFDYSRIRASDSPFSAGNNSKYEQHGNIYIGNDVDADRFLTNAGLIREGELNERSMAT